jgi:undecaprenyl-diphosphatase
MKQLIQEIDTSLFFYLYNFSSSPVIKEIALFMGDYFIYIASVIFIFVVYKRKSRNSEKVALYLSSLVSVLLATAAIGQLTKFFYERPRPFIALSLPHFLTGPSHAFPSLHTAYMYALATIAYFFDKRLAYFLYVSGLFVGIARITGGVHYPSDIIGGIVIGVSSALLVHTIVTRIFIKHK